MEEDLNEFLKDKDIKDNIVKLVEEEWKELGKLISKYTKTVIKDYPLSTNFDKLSGYAKITKVGGIYFVIK